MNCLLRLTPYEVGLPQTLIKARVCDADFHSLTLFCCAHVIRSNRGHLARATAAPPLMHSEAARLET